MNCKLQSFGYRILFWHQSKSLTCLLLHSLHTFFIIYVQSKIFVCVSVTRGCMWNLADVVDQLLICRVLGTVHYLHVKGLLWAEFALKWRFPFLITSNHFNQTIGFLRNSSSGSDTHDHKLASILCWHLNSFQYHKLQAVFWQLDYNIHDEGIAIQ